MTISKELEVLAPESTCSTLPLQSLRYACLVASSVTLVILATIIILRGGFPVHMGSMLKITGTSLLVINAATFGSRRGGWLLCGPMVSILTLLVITAVGLSPLGVSPLIGIVITVMGGLACAGNLGFVVARAGLMRATVMVCLGVFLGVYAESMYFRFNAEHHILYPEAILAGQVHADVLWQADIVNMLSTYRFAFTGIDGVVPMKYHTGSLWMAEGLRRLCGFTALDFNAFGVGVLLIPFYVAGLFSCTGALRAAVGSGSSKLSTTLYAASAVVLVGLFPFVEDPMHLNFNETIINSDSFLLAMAVSLQLITVAIQFFARARSRQYKLSSGDKFAAALLIPVMLGLVGFVKISQMYLLLELVVYVSWRARWMRVWPFVVSTAGSILLLGYMLHTEVGSKPRFAPFNFDRVPLEWVPYFFVFYFAWPWLLLILWMRVERVSTISEFVQAVRARRTLPLELVLVTVVTGLVPYLLVDFHAPNWKFFLEFQGIFAGLFVAALLPEVSLKEPLTDLRAGTLRLETCLFFFLLLAVFGHIFITTAASVHRLAKANGTVRAVLAGLPDTEWRGELRQIRARRTEIVGLAARRLNLEHCLAELGRKSVEERRKTILYIPKTNRDYWDMRQVGVGATPFIAPALSGIPMVQGLPEFEDIGWAVDGWGYPQYKLPTKPEVPSDESEKAIAKARAGGFQELLILYSPSSESCNIRRIELVPVAKKSSSVASN